MIVKCDNDSIRTEDLPQTCDWPVMPNAPSSSPANGDDSSVLTQDLPNTADWELLLAPAVSDGNNKFKINKEEQRAASQQDSQASILTNDLPQTCDWILPVATHHKNSTSNTSDNKGKTAAEQRIHDEEDTTSSTSSTMKDITETKRQDEATSSSSTVLFSVPNKRLPCNAHSKASRTNNENCNPDYDNSTISSLSPTNPVPTKQQKLTQRQQPQILKVQNESSKNALHTPRLNHHHSLPTEIPIIKQNGPFASPLSTGSISTVDDSPPPKQPSTRKSNWFQKKKRRKLKQTTLNFALK